MTDLSPTPLTDAVIRHDAYKYGSTGSRFAQLFDLARSLERSLAERDARIAELEGLRKDAERLQFLCSRMFMVELSPDGRHKWIFRNKPLIGENVQAAIDEARSEK